MRHVADVDRAASRRRQVQHFVFQSVKMCLVHSRSVSMDLVFKKRLRLFITSLWNGTLRTPKTQLQNPLWLPMSSRSKIRALWSGFEDFWVLVSLPAPPQLDIWTIPRYRQDGKYLGLRRNGRTVHMSIACAPRPLHQANAMGVGVPQTDSARGSRLCLRSRHMEHNYIPSPTPFLRLCLPPGIPSCQSLAIDH